MKVSVFIRKLSPYRAVFSFGIGLLALVIAGVFLVRLIAPVWSFVSGFIAKPFATLSILQDPTKALKSTDGRTNILILGRGGAEHDAPDLTDTMMIVSIRLSDRKTSIISIPRDLWIQSMRAKINSAYYYGEQKQADGGITFAKDAVFQVTDLPIQYVVVVDFSGFEKAIDLVGGVDINVQRSFTDEKYPVETVLGEKPTPTSKEPIYRTVHFDAGLQHMDAETALVYSRSRYSTDPEEGSDFARSKRQQQVLLSLLSKMKQKETVLNTARIKELRSLFEQYIKTDVTDDELLALGRIGMNMDLAAIQRIGLDMASDDTGNLLVSPPTSKYGQWVLESRIGKWTEIQTYISNELRQ